MKPVRKRFPILLNRLNYCIYICISPELKSALHITTNSLLFLKFCGCKLCYYISSHRAGDFDMIMLLFKSRRFQK